MNANMTARLQSFAMILQQTLLLWRTRGRLWLPLVALLSIAPFTLTIGWYSGKWDMAISVGIGGPLAVIVLPFWVFIVANLQAQNSPANAQLVPQLHRRLLQLVLLGWPLAASLFALLASISLGHFWHLLGLFLLLLPCFTLVMNSLWGSIALVALTFILDQPGITPLQWWWHTGPVAIAGGLLLALAIGTLTFRHLLRKGDARHRARHAEVTRFQKMMVEDQSGNIGWRNWLQSTPWLQRLDPDRLRLRWQLPTAGSDSGRRPVRRLFAALPPHFHATGPVINMVLAMLAMWLVGVQPLLNPWGFIASHLIAATLVGLALVLPIAFVWRMLAALHQSRREQQLLHLLPHMPDGAALNRRLLASLLGQFALVWLLTLAGGLYVILLDLDNMIPQLAPALSILTLPYGLLLLRDHAKSVAPTPGSLLVPVMVTMALGFCWKLAQIAWQPLALGYLAAAVGIPTLIFGLWRWRQLLRAPGAFPVGRLA